MWPCKRVRGSKVNVEDSDNFTPLHLAAAKDRVEVVDLLLSHGGNPHHKSTDGISALHVCASRGLIGNTRALVAAGANVNAVDISDRTPLYLAVSRRQHDVVKFLIEKGAKVNLEEIHGYTPLFEAVYANDVPLVEMLVSAGAKVTHSHHLLHYAIMHRHEAMVRELLRAGCIVNLRNESGDTPLMLAVRSQCPSIVRVLLEHGASVNCVNYVSRQTALQGAITYNNRDCQQFTEIFSILDEFGWDWEREKDALCFSITANNDHAVATLVRRCDIVADKTLVERNEMLNLLLLRENRYLVELFIYAGFNLMCFEPCDSSVVVRNGLLPFLRNPLSLQGLARIRIRSALKYSIYRKVDSLPLPSILKAFLRLQDMPCYCEIQQESDSSRDNR